MQSGIHRVPLLLTTICARKCVVLPGGGWSAPNMVLRWPGVMSVFRQLVSTRAFGQNQLLRDRQPERKHRTLPELAGDTDPSAMRFDDRFHDRQSHSGTLNAITLALSAVELVEDERTLEIVDSAASVGNVGD